MHQQSSESMLTVAAKLSPPATVLGASAAGMTLQDWVWAATLTYTVLMIAKLVWDWLIKPNLRNRDP
jgi:hypothetical protein